MKHRQFIVGKKYIDMYVLIQTEQFELETILKANDRYTSSLLFSPRRTTQVACVHFQATIYKRNFYLKYFEWIPAKEKMSEEK